MDINLKSPVSILKNIGVFMALMIVAGVAFKLVGMAVDMALPGYGDKLKSLARI